MATGYPKLDKTFVDNFLQSYYLEISGNETTSLTDFTNTTDPKDAIIQDLQNQLASSQVEIAGKYYDTNGEITDISPYEWYDMEIIDPFNQTYVFRYLKDKSNGRFIGGGFVSIGEAFNSYLNFHGGLKKVNYISHTDVDILIDGSNTENVIPSDFFIDLNKWYVNTDNNPAYFNIDIFTNTLYEGQQNTPVRYVFYQNGLTGYDREPDLTTKSLRTYIEYGEFRGLTVSNT